MKPFLLLSTRPEDRAAESEKLAVAGFGGLAATELIQFRLEAAPLPQLDLNQYSGLVLGGGPFNASDAAKSRLQLRIEAELDLVLEQVITQDFPFLGLCYGVGAVTSYLGGVVEKRFGEPVGAVPLTLTPEGRADPLLSELPTKFRAFVGHKEAVSRLPSSATLLVSGIACPVQMFRVGQNCYVTQFHPELDADGLAERIQIYQCAGYFEPNQTDTLIAQAHQAKLDPAVHSIVRRFVEKYRS